MSIAIANAPPCHSRPPKKTHGRSSHAPTLWVRSCRVKSPNWYHSVHSSVSKTASKVWCTFPNWPTVTSIPPNRSCRSTKCSTSRSSTSTSSVVASRCLCSRPTKASTQKVPTSTQPCTVWLPTTTKKATTSTQKASILKPTNGWKASKKNAPHGNSSTLTPRHAGKHTRNRLDVTWPKQKKLLPPAQPTPPVPPRTPLQMKKLQKKTLAPWLPTKHWPHCAKN